MAAEVAEVARVMNRYEQTLDQQLDALLKAWHEYAKGYQHTRGFASDRRTTGAYSTPGHMDWWNGSAHDRADELQVRAVDDAIQNIPNEPERWRTALEFHARNLYLGITVWYSPHLPPTREARDVLLLEARNKLMLQLRSMGVMGW